MRASARIPAVTLLLVGAGGFLGAISRYVIDGWVSDLTGGKFPWGTLLLRIDVGESDQWHGEPL